MGHRVVAAIAIITTAFLVAGCAGSRAPEPGGTSSLATQTTASKPTSGKQLGPQQADREVHELTGFASHSGNISCMVDADFARCDIIDRNWSPPPRPADCEFDYGQGISLSPGEQPQFVCAGDTAVGADEVLPYGQSITAGVLRCESAQSWITCRYVHTGHGFSISREAYRLF